MSHYDEVIDKYKNNFYGLLDSPPVGSKVVYLPYGRSVAYTLGDSAYDHFSFSPGDIMTIKGYKKVIGQERYSVLCFEHACPLSPAELVPVECVDKKDIVEIRRLYDILKKDFDKIPKPNVIYGPEYKGPFGKKIR